MKDLPYLVQRLKVRRWGAEGKTSVSRYFEFDYMGSAEFEFGSIPAAMKALRAQDFKSWRPIELGHDGHSLWFVGPDSLKSTALRFFKGQMKEDRSHRLKEPSMMRAALTGRDSFGEMEHAREFVGWFSIDHGLEFTLFTKNVYAEQWIMGLKDGPKKE